MQNHCKYVLVLRCFDSIATYIVTYVCQLCIHCRDNSSYRNTDVFLRWLAAKITTTIVVTEWLLWTGQCAAIFDQHYIAVLLSLFEYKIELHHCWDYVVIVHCYDCFYVVNCVSRQQMCTVSWPCLNYTDYSTLWFGTYNFDIP